MCTAYQKQKNTIQQLALAQAAGLARSNKSRVCSQQASQDQQLAYMGLIKCVHSTEDDSDSRAIECVLSHPRNITPSHQAVHLQPLSSEQQ